MGKCLYGWLIYPERSGWPATLFACFVGACAWLVEWRVPKDSTGSSYVPSVMISLLLGAIIANVLPVRRCLGLDGGRVNWKDGLSFIDKMVLRGAVILLGFSLQSKLLTSNWSLLLVSVVTCAFEQPLAFFAAQLTGRKLKLSHEARDMISVGTMICGASAITALQAVLLTAQGQASGTSCSRRQDKLAKYAGLCTSAVFLYSLVALLVFRYIASAVGFSDAHSGLWAGLAVNDLSSAIAVGSEFGTTGQSFATLSKTVRILTLAPHLLWLGFRAASREQELSKIPGPASGAETGVDTQQRRPARVPLCKTLWANFPLFMSGFVLLFLVRLTLDLSLTSDDSIQAIKRADEVLKLIAKAMMNTVTAGIGLRLEAQALRKAWRYVVAEGVAWCTVAVVSLGMLVLYDKLLIKSNLKLAAVCGAGVGLLLISVVVYRCCRQRVSVEVQELRDTLQEARAVSWLQPSSQ